MWQRLRALNTTTQHSVRCLSYSRTLRQQAAAATQSEPTATPAAAAAPAEQKASKPRIESSVAKGSVLKGINFLKDGSDPIAMDDHEYPDWLWDLLDEKKQKQKSSKPSNRQYHRKQNRDAIKAQNFMKDKKT